MILYSDLWKVKPIRHRGFFGLGDTQPPCQSYEQWALNGPLGNEVCNPLDQACTCRNSQRSVARSNIQIQYHGCVPIGANITFTPDPTGAACGAGTPVEMPSSPSVSAAPILPAFHPQPANVPLYVGAPPPNATTAQLQEYAQTGTFTPTVTTPQTNTQTTATTVTNNYSASFSFSNITRGTAGIFYPGDVYQVVISGAKPNSPVTVSGSSSGGSFSNASMGSTDGQGNFSKSAAVGDGDIGSWNEVWSVGGTQVGSVSFVVQQPATTTQGIQNYTNDTSGGVSQTTVQATQTPSTTTGATFTQELIAGIEDFFSPSMWSDVIANGSGGELLGMALVPVVGVSVAWAMFGKRGRR